MIGIRKIEECNECERGVREECEVGRPVPRPPAGGGAKKIFTNFWTKQVRTKKKVLT